ncbi:hypothetical protein Ddc_17659 [Ditylenchus destructor]|nr:hypothetical protein Ddc_17659 [Ditylenchus destructor]
MMINPMIPDGYNGKLYRKSAYESVQQNGMKAALAGDSFASKKCKELSNLATSTDDINESKSEVASQSDLAKK